MKKFMAMLLAMSMLLSLAACSSQEAAAPAAAAAGSQETEAKAEAPGEVEVVTYYCSIGAYLGPLQEEINKWNEGAGKEKGIFIELTSDINSYDENLDALLTSGAMAYDIFDAGLDYPWRVDYCYDLNTIENESLKALVASYNSYSREGFNVLHGKEFALPLEVVPVKFAVNKDLFDKNNLELPKTWDDIVNAAKVITENGGGEEFGFGWSNWSWSFYRLMMKFSAPGNGKIWWDPTTETYDFTQYKVPMEALTTMYQNDWMMGADDLGIDEIRAQFAAGKVGMFPAPSYDVGVYTTQFPAQCNWVAIDPPVINEGESYKGIYLERVSASISTSVTLERLDAVAEALAFLNGDEVNQKMYQSTGMIPYKESLMEGVALDVESPQFEFMADTTNYVPMCLYPDYEVTIEGEDANEVFNAVMHGEVDFDTAAEDLRSRFQAGYDAGKASGIDLERFHYNYSLAK